ncbi:hypothetical protein ACFQX4_25480, partial [Roseomonas sp. GCM10028921]
ALARMGTDKSCSFDLHRLLPVPPGILALGPEEGASKDWLRTHWGVTRPLRHVELLPSTLDGRRKRMGQLRLGFWSADWSPWQAVARLRRAWPELSLELRPRYSGSQQQPDEEKPTHVPERKGRKRQAGDGARRGG